MDNLIPATSWIFLLLYAIVYIGILCLLIRWIFAIDKNLAIQQKQLAMLTRIAEKLDVDKTEIDSRDNS